MSMSALSVAETGSSRLGASLIISQVAYAVMQVYIPWFAAAHTPIAEVAMLSLAQSIVWPLAMLTQLQLRRIYLLRSDGDLLAVFYRIRLLGCGFLVVAAVAAAAFTGSGRLLLGLALMLALIKAVEGVSDIGQAEFQRALRPEKAAWTQTVRCAIFIAAYTVSLTLSSNLVWSLMLALAAMSVWVGAIDLRGTFRPRRLGKHAVHAVPDILRSGVLLSSATALTSVSIMVGRWAAMQEGDVTTMAAAALAATVSSVVALLLSTCQQFSIPGARSRFLSGGVEACKASLSATTRALHFAFAGMVLAWAGAFLVASSYGVSLPRLGESGSLMNVTFALAGCYLVSGWLSVLSFKGTMVLMIAHRHRDVLAVAAMQALVAAAISFTFYPFVGWHAIALAELARGCTAWMGATCLARKPAGL
jgi:hypothetical protein